MNGRTFAVIFVFWALLTIITPVLVHMSNSEKSRSISYGDWRNGVMRTRRMMVHLKRNPISHPCSEGISLAPAPGPEIGEASKSNKDEVGD
ncbi:hypothetical protein SAY87_004882 [Trapa incisa]|uniref:Uncharacterized protein n=1 Tax=Trapa incisa TaxID=236973 RepID=A0AAN7PTL2_9MYRT|nr:hypothetical protein SAY87_004882 [Trapa incisa]